MKKSGGVRNAAVKVKTAKKRKISSTLWLQRQLNDPYVISAKREGYRARSAYKLLEIDAKYPLLKPGKTLLDLGAVPGSWSQIAAEKIGKKGKVIAVDIQDMASIPGVDFIHGDFAAPEIQEKIRALLPAKADIIISDMAPSATGHNLTDHLRIMGLADEVLEFTKENMNRGGALLIKLLRGGGENKYFNELREYFKEVKYIKPASSRGDSREIFIVARGFK